MTKQSTELFYRRDLPHWQPENAIIFVSTRLAGSLPKATLQRLAGEKARLRSQPWRENETGADRRARINKQYFAKEDRALAEEIRLGPQQSSGDAGKPLWLSDPRVAQLVRDCIHYWVGRRYLLHRYVIMPNHLHLLMQPLRKESVRPVSVEPEGIGLALSETAKGHAPPADFPYWPLSVIMGTLKGFTSRQANLILERNGAFWQKESFDHWIRDELEYHGVIAYIDHNPVGAGLCARPEEWIWSSAHEEAERLRGR